MATAEVCPIFKVCKTGGSGPYQVDLVDSPGGVGGPNLMTLGKDEDAAAIRVIALLGCTVKNAAHDITMVNFSNLIDMNYNYLDNKSYHLKHFAETPGALNNMIQVPVTAPVDTPATPGNPAKKGEAAAPWTSCKLPVIVAGSGFETNCPGFVACHMFAEYLTNAKGITYSAAINEIMAYEGLTPLEKYIGTSYAHSTWRMSKIFTHRSELVDNEKPPKPTDFSRSFTSIFKEDSVTLKKDAVQLRVCAFLLKSFLDTPAVVAAPLNAKLTDEDKNATAAANETTYIYEPTNLVITDFPEYMRKFVGDMKIWYAGPSAIGGGRSAPCGRRQAASSPAYVKSSETAKVGGKMMRVYVGQRGGKYVRMGGEYVPLSKCKKGRR
jgi:hypothetical protein